MKEIQELDSAEGGKSGAMIFFTHSQKFVIKTISRSERLSLLHMLPDYFTRIKSSDSRLSRIIGLFRLNPTKQDFIVMENIISDISDAVIFDIKGSSLDRLVSGNYDYTSPPYGRVLKDLNLQASGFKFDIQPLVKDRILDEIVSDFAMLVTYGIMDYSVLVAFYRPKVVCATRYDIQGIREVYSVGIIDFLQKYNIKKKSEKCLKKLFFRNHEVSCEEPQIYGDRISKVMKDIFGENS